MIQTPPDLFDEWMALPVPLESDDERFIVRRATEADFERVWDCVDAAFGRTRPRALYEWLYRSNPFGRARIWIVEERATGRVVKTGAYYPWPIWRGDEPLVGSLSGDAATAPEWQRKGLSAIRRRVRRSHPWSRTIASIAGPNEGSRTVTNKAGEGSSILGPLRGGIAVLRGEALARRAGLPAPLARAAGVAIDPLGRLWPRVGLRRQETPPRVETVDRFTTDFDAVTLRTMRFPMYWCPHNADFLNWRYVDHPVESYVGLALVEHEAPVAYAVLRLAGEEASIAEFAASPDRAEALMQVVLERAREAGAAWVTFFATPGWRHWGVFRRAGFLRYTTKNYLDAVYWPRKEESERMDAWQVTPGDRDYR